MVKPLIGPIMDLVNPFALGMLGAKISCRIIENVKLAGLQIETIENLASTVFRLIHADPGSSSHDQKSVTEEVK